MADGVPEGAGEGVRLAVLGGDSEGVELLVRLADAVGKEVVVRPTVGEFVGVSDGAGD